ncbi:MAG: hypothetical protein AB4426_22680 [Xenococcaceae cyanobacterium]
MKNIKSLGILGLLVLALLTFALTVFLSQPSDATSTRNQRQINLGSIDEVRTPEELGLDSLEQKQVELADNSIIQAIYQAEEQLAIMPEDIPLRFDLGTNSPIRIGWLPDQGQLARTGYEALGYVDISGLRQAFSPVALMNLFAKARTAFREGRIPAINDILQSRRIPAINLIARDQQTDRTFLISEVNLYAVCRDAVNAVLNQTLRENNYDLRRLW